MRDLDSLLTTVLDIQQHVRAVQTKLKLAILKILKLLLRAQIIHINLYTMRRQVIKPVITLLVPAIQTQIVQTHHRLGVHIPNLVHHHVAFPQALVADVLRA